MQQQHIRTIDFMRGFAALFVCLFHLTRNASYYGDYLPEDNILRILGTYGWAGVQIFFVISGFIIPYTLFRNDYSYAIFPKFIAKRWLRLEPPYIISIFIVLAEPLVGNHIKEFSIDWAQVGLHLVYLPNFFGKPWLNDIYWTLALEFQFYIVMALLFPLLVHDRKEWRYVALLIFGGMQFLCPDGRLVFSYSSLFLMGMVVFLCRQRFISTAETLALLCICAVYSYFQFAEHPLVIASAALLSGITIWKVRIDNSIGRFTGRISYSLYLTHSVVGNNFIGISMHIGAFRDNILLRSCWVIAAMGFSVLCAWIFYKVIERPSQRLSHRIKYHERDGPEEDSLN